MRLEENCWSAYKITVSPAADDIFWNIDAQRNTLITSFHNYTAKIEHYIEKNEQPLAETAERIQLWQQLRTTIEPHINGGFLALGGSTMSRLATRGADVDLCFAIRDSFGEYSEDSGTVRHVLARIFCVLSDNSMIRDLRYIDAKVPILKVKPAFPHADIEVDINCNCVAGIYNSHLLYYYANIDERFRQLNMVLKEWAKVHEVVNPRFGKLNSYTISLMIIHYLQCGVEPPILPNLYRLFPQHFGGTMDVDKLDYNLELELPYMPENSRTVGELIYGFLEYYSRFNYDEWGISIREGCIFDRSEQPESDRQFLFFLEEAYDGMTVPKNLTVRKKLYEIVYEFQQSRRIILRDICSGQRTPPVDTSRDFVCPRPGPDEQNGLQLPDIADVL